MNIKIIAIDGLLRSYVLFSILVTHLSLLDTSEILAEISQMLIACWPHICLKTTFQLASHTIHQDRWKLNNFLRRGNFIFVTSSLKVYHHIILKSMMPKFLRAAWNVHWKHRHSRSSSPGEHRSEYYDMILLAGSIGSSWSH